MTSIEKIQQEIAELRQELVDHPIYRKIQKPEDVKIFMEHHVFAVWDFMSLLKSLQINLTCVKTPWLPVGNASTRYLINEIVVGEESDIDPEGGRTSHFELYLKSMQQTGADISLIKEFISCLQQGYTIQDALMKTNLPHSIHQFVTYTFEVIDENKPHVQAAVFTFGREDLIPDMFVAMVQDLNETTGGRTELFKYYLERHIEVDGDHHSHLALQMTEELIDLDEVKLQEASQAVIKALKSRIQLWDGVVNAIAKQSLILNAESLTFKA
ncbi:MAG: DUF3050 domain-containing protein [Sphingobacteriaceae bacterium]